MSLITKYHDVIMPDNTDNSIITHVGFSNYLTLLFLPYHYTYIIFILISSNSNGMHFINKPILR